MNTAAATRIRTNYPSVEHLATETLLPLVLRFEIDQDKAVDVAMDIALAVSWTVGGRTYMHSKFRTEADLLKHIERVLG